MNIKSSIIIPTFNEEMTIIKILKKINQVFNNSGEYEIIIVDDCSTDNTTSILNQNKDLFNNLIINKKNIGKGGCIKKALEIAKHDYIFFQDADDEYDPEDFKKFFDVINKFKPDLIIGSRFNYSNYTRSHYFLNKLGNKIISNLFNILNNTTFTDIYSCYVVFKKDLINPRDLKTFGFEQQAEILSKIVRDGKKFYEVPINYNGRTYEEGKKIKFYDIFPVIFQIIKCRLI